MSVSDLLSVQRSTDAASSVLLRGWAMSVSSGTKVCPSCGTGNGSFAVACGRCGAGLRSSPARDSPFVLVRCPGCDRNTRLTPTQIESMKCARCGRRFCMMDPFEVLGVKAGALPQEVEQAFARLAQIYHPDRYGTASDDVRREAETRMKRLTEARDFLKRYVEPDDGRGPSETPPPRMHSEPSGTSPDTSRPAPSPTSPDDAVNAKLVLGGGAALMIASLMPWIVSHNLRMGTVNVSGLELREWVTLIAGAILGIHAWVAVDEHKSVSKGLVLTIGSLLALFFLYQFNDVSAVMSAGAPVFQIEAGAGLYVGVLGTVWLWRVVFGHLASATQVSIQRYLVESVISSYQNLARPPCSVRSANGL